MVKTRFTYLITVIVFLAGSFAFSQQKKIDEKKNELTEIKKQINDLEKQVNQKTRKEKDTYSTLANYNQQNFLLNKLINKLKKEERQKEKEIVKSKSEISSLEKEIKTLKENYSKYVVSIYKYGTPEELEMLINSKSFQQALLRFKYLQKFTERRKTDLEDIKASIAKLNKLKARLEKEKREKELLAREKEAEERDLSAKMKESNKILAAIKHDKRELKNEIEAKKGAEDKIKDLIANLIEKENRRREEAARLANANANKEKNNESISNESSYDVDLSTNNFSSFSTLKGKLNWPVRKATIIRKFGQNKNKKLNTVTLNYGVDMKVFNDMDVKAVADGVVSAIDWIPGYGSVVIVTHKGDFRTVYSHLGDIFVNEGDKLKTGSLIGKVGESLEGNILHFEIWNARDHKNPSVWLAKK
ncbi:MAG: peptidoglycan DD-metalloendopeptidase family protein [Ignavibacteriaceae bacterium]